MDRAAWEGLHGLHGLPEQGFMDGAAQAALAGLYVMGCMDRASWTGLHGQHGQGCV